MKNKIREKVAELQNSHSIYDVPHAYAILKAIIDDIWDKRDDVDHPSITPLLIKLSAMSIHIAEFLEDQDILPETDRGLREELSKTRDLIRQLFHGCLHSTKPGAQAGKVIHTIDIEDMTLYNKLLETANES